MLMCAALGLPIEMPICGRGKPGMRGENGALTPETLTLSLLEGLWRKREMEASVTCSLPGLR